MRRGAHRRLTRGFTLLEAIAVLVIVGIILAITIPEFTGSAGTGQDMKSETSINAAISAEVEIFNNTGSFADPTTSLAQVQNEAPDITITTSSLTSSANPPENTGTFVSLQLSGSPVDPIIAAASLAENGDCLYFYHEYATPTSTATPTQSELYGLELNGGSQSCSASTASTLSTEYSTYLAQNPTDTSKGNSWSNPLTIS